MFNIIKEAISPFKKDIKQEAQYVAKATIIEIVRNAACTVIHKVMEKIQEKMEEICEFRDLDINEYV